MKALNVLQISDLHILAAPGATMLGVDTEYYFHRTLAQAFASHHGFDLILLTGDLAQEATAASYQRIANHLAGYQTPCLCLPGNHDDFALMQEHLRNDWVSCDKQIALGNWRVLLLNSQIENNPAGKLAESEMAWLETMLQNRADSFFLVAVHHHAYPSGCAWLDGMGIENGKALCQQLARHGNVKALINGHIHQALAKRYQHIDLLAAPSTCFQFAPDSANFRIDDASPGYRVLELFDDGSLNTACYRLPETLKGLDIDNRGY